MPPRRAPPRTRGGGGAHRRTVDPNPDSKEEVLDIHSLPDSSISPEAASHLPDATIDLVSDATEEREGGDRGSVTSRRNATTEDEEDEMMEMEEVDLPSTSRSAASTDGDGNADQDQGLEMEPVDIEGEEDADADADDATSRIPEEHTLAYAAAYASASASDAGDEAESAADASMDGGSGANRRAGKESSGSAPVFKDGKGQPRGVEITMASAPKQSVKKKINTGASPRERLARLEAHKLHAVALLAHARIRNRWCNDEDLRVSIQ